MLYDRCGDLGEELQAKKAEVLKSSKAEQSNANRSKTPTKSGCSRHMTGVKSYLYKYVEQLGPKVVFGDDSTCTTEGYGSIKCNGIVFIKVAFVYGLKYNLISISQLYNATYIVQFNEKRVTIFNSNKEVVMIALRTYSSELQNNQQTGKTKSCYWSPSLVYSKDKPCLSCEKGKNHRANFKTKQKNLKLSCPSSNELKIKMTSNSNNSELTMVLNSGIASLSTSVMKKGFLKTSPLPTHLNKMVLLKGKNRTLIEAARTMLS
ncbi:hypothetical protein Tco_1466552 [Tanacetum coccineum]